MPFDPIPTTLTGHGVTLEPLEPRHAPGLFEAGHDEDTWRYLPDPTPTHVDAIGAWIATALSEPAAIPFAIVVDGRPAGSTR